MKDTRAGRYGVNLGILIEYTINTIPEDVKEEYKTRFMTELNKYSIMPRIKGEPKNEGCVHELSDLLKVDITNPEQFAKLVKEGIHLMYQKNTSSKVLIALNEYLRL